MRPMNEAMDVNPTATNNGAVKLVEHWKGKTLSVFRDGAGTIQIQGSSDGTNYFQIGSDVTADGFFAIEGTNGMELFPKFLRIRTTVSTGAAPVVTLTGFHARSDGG